MRFGRNSATPSFLVFIISVIGVIGVGAFAAGCVGSGRPVEEARALPAFDSLEISGSLIVRVEVGPEVSCLVRGDDNLVHRVETAVVGGRLHVRSPRPAIQDEPIEVFVTVPNVKAIGVSLAGDVELFLGGAPTQELAVRLTGAGKLILDGVDATRFSVTVEGAGNVEVLGRAETLAVDFTGVGAGKLGGLCVQDATLSMSGASKVTVSASRRLEARASGAASINYYGAPKVIYEETGANGLHHLGDPICTP